MGGNRWGGGIEPISPPHTHNKYKLVFKKGVKKRKKRRKGGGKEGGKDRKKDRKDRKKKKRRKESKQACYVLQDKHPKPPLPTPCAALSSSLQKFSSHNCRESSRGRIKFIRHSCVISKFMSLGSESEMYNFQIIYNLNTSIFL